MTIRINLKLVFCGFLLFTVSGCASRRDVYTTLSCDRECWTVDSTVVWVVDSASIGVDPPPLVISASDTVGLKEPVVLTRPKPAYPASVLASLQTRYRVWTLLWIGADGRVRQARLHAREPREIVPAILEAASRYTFKPATQNGIPIDVLVEAPFLYPK